MKSRTGLYGFSLLVVSSMIFPLAAFGSSFPSLTLSNSGSTVQAIVSNGDPNAPVLFYYPSGSSNASVNIGTTDANGYLTVQINPASYSLSAGVPVYVRVNSGQSPTATWPVISAGSSGVTLYLTQTSVSLATGQSVTVTASNVVGSLSIPGNTNPSVASASIDGNVITINGSSNGTSAITVCASSSGCSTINVTVQPSYLPSAAIYLNPNTLNMNIGQNQVVSITGFASGPYYVSNNTGQNSVSVSVNNSNLVLTGLAVGSSNITVCATGGQCASMFVNVSSTGSAPAASGMNPVLSSITISPNNQSASFAGADTSLALSFSINQTVNVPTVRVNNTNVLVNGSGSGPYTANYTVIGNESMPIPVAIRFANPNGATGQAYLWIGNSASAAPAAPSVPAASSPASNANTTTAIDCPTGYSCAANPGSAAASSNAPSAASGSSSYAFNRYLYEGMTAKGTADPDVTALQNRLKKDGYFSGTATGWFGPATKAAVQAYQRAYGLSPLGVVGPGTRALLNQGK